MADRNPQGDGHEQDDGQLAGRGGGESSRESPAVGRGARIPSVPLAFVAIEGSPGFERASECQGRDDVIDVYAEPPPPPVGRHLFYSLAPNLGTQDGCGRVGLRKEEGTRPGQAHGCGCPSGNFSPCRRWVGGLRSPYGAVGGMRGCVPAFPWRRQVCWNGT